MRTVDTSALPVRLRRGLDGREPLFELVERHWSRLAAAAEPDAASFVSAVDDLAGLMLLGTGNEDAKPVGSAAQPRDVDDAPAPDDSTSDVLATGDRPSEEASWRYQLVQAGALAVFSAPSDPVGAVLDGMLTRLSDLTDDAELRAVPSLIIGDLLVDPKRNVVIGSHVLQAIANHLTAVSEQALERIARVFATSSKGELGRLLDVSHTSVASWSAGRQPLGANAERIRAVDAVARLLDDYVDSNDLVRFVRDLELPALDGRTVFDAVADDPESTYAALERALVW